MSDTLFVQIIDAVIALHGAPGRPPNVPELEGLRTIGFGPEDLPASVIYPEVTDPALRGGDREPVNPTDFGFVIEHRVKGNGSQRIDKIADPLIAWASQTIGGKSQLNPFLFKRIVEGPLEWKFEQGEYVYCLVKQRFYTALQTKVGDLTSWA